MTKQAARTHFMEQRNLLTLPQQHGLVAAMMGHFQQMNFAPCQFVLSYRPLADRNEVPIHFFEDMLLDNFPDARLCYPAANFDNGSMQAYENNAALEWETVRFGIEQPRRGDAIAAQTIDVVFVPLLGFDIKGNRLGYGKGFYDRYLGQCSENVISIGFSFFEALPAITDIAPHDVPLKYCVTPQTLYVF